MAQDFLTDAFIRLRQKLKVISGRVIADSEGADDVLQDSFVRLWRKQYPLQSEKEAEALLTRAVKNASLNERRRKRGVPMVMDMADETPDAEEKEEAFEQLKRMANTAKRWYKLPSYRLNFPEYAERAIEETCINHLIHRDMAVKGSEVHIDIYDDRIEFYSPGGMLDGTRIQDQDYRKVASKRRNPILAEVFSQLDYMEKRGSGLRKIVSRTESLAAYTKDKTPYFRSDSSSFFTIIPNVNYGLTDADFQRIIDANGGKDETIERYPEIGVGDLGSTTKKLHQKTTHKLPKRTTHKQTDKQLGTTSQLIMDRLVDDPLATMDKLAAITGISPDGVKWQLDKLKKEGYIERQGSRRSGSWKVLIKK